MVHHDLTLKSPRGDISIVPPSEPEDVLIAQLRSHPTTRRHIPYLPETVTESEMRERRLKAAADPNAISFHIHDAQGTFIGTTGLHHIDWDNESFEVGIGVSPDCHSKGVATGALYCLLKYAFETKNLHRGVFETGAGNDQMRGWLNMAGATLEAESRETWKEKDGSFSNAMTYSILAKEWAEKTKGILEKRLGLDA